MGLYNELEDEYEANLEAEQDCKRCGDTCDVRYENFQEGLCEFCQEEDEVYFNQYVKL